MDGWKMAKGSRYVTRGSVLFFYTSRVGEVSVMDGGYTATRTSTNTRLKKNQKKRTKHTKVGVFLKKKKLLFPRKRKRNFFELNETSFFSIWFHLEKKKRFRKWNVRYWRRMLVNHVGNISKRQMMDRKWPIHQRKTMANRITVDCVVFAENKKKTQRRERI